MAGIKTAVIAGGGIGGLTAAIALRRAGIDVTIIERAKEYQEIGAGLWLWQNAMAALDTLAMGDTVRAAGVRNAHGGVGTWQGKRLVERVPSNPDYESVAILRADLQTALLQGIDQSIIEYGVVCTAFAQDEQGVTVHLSDGRELRGDILIGADGIHSIVRSQLFGAISPQYAGFTAWRAVTTFPHDRIPSGVAWGCGARFGFMPVQQGRVNWFAGIKVPAGTPESISGRKQEVLQHFRNWFEPVPEVIEATDETEIIRNDIYYGPRLTTWSQGRVTLLGDAAHAMTPSIGQGACQAIEDAVVLGSCLRENQNPAEALQDYERRRITRANAVTRYARFMDWLALWDNAPLCGLRNLVIGHVPNWWRDRQLEWIINQRFVS